MSFPIPLGRREMLKLCTIAASGCLVRPHESMAYSVPGKDSFTSLNRFPRMVQESFLWEMNALAQSPAEKIRRLDSREAVDGYLNTTRDAIRSCFGPLPERTPLNPRTTGIVDRDAYRIEKVIYESRPNFLVTANLYIPKGFPFPRPGVIGTCGHSHNGKAAPTYQSFAQGLARLGFVCLIFDPIGQGERLQFPDDHGGSTVGAGVAEHLMAGNQQFLVGEFLGTWRAWDGIRSLDYLLTRDEVDPKHIGVTGNSGGGTMTTWLCGLEDRWTMAAPSCFVTTFRRNLENELPADTEQCPPSAIRFDLDHCDFIAAMAPKPVVLIAQEGDYFDVRGTQEAFEFLKHVYRMLDAEESISLHVGPGEHGFHQDGREAMYRCFQRACGLPQVQKEPPIKLEKDEVLWCTPNGQVAPMGSRPLHSATAELSNKLAVARGPKVDVERIVEFLSDGIEADAPQLEAQPDSERGPTYRILRPLGNRGYPRPHATTYAIRTARYRDEPEVCALVCRVNVSGWYSRPAATDHAILYVAHQSSDSELREEPLIRELAKANPESALYACDVRGIGESRPDTCGANSFLKPYGSDYFYAIHSLMFDHPYVCQRTLDLIVVLRWLHSLSHSHVHLVAKGWGAIPATFAALLATHDSRYRASMGDIVRQVTLKNALTSYADVAQAETYRWPLSSFLPGVLAEFDLPDCYDHLAKAVEFRNLDPWDANGGA